MCTANYEAHSTLAYRAMGIANPVHRRSIVASATATNANAPRASNSPCVVRMPGIGSSRIHFTDYELLMNFLPLT